VLAKGTSVERSDLIKGVFVDLACSIGGVVERAVVHAVGSRAKSGPKPPIGSAVLRITKEGIVGPR
jgi:hypothetical protein